MSGTSTTETTPETRTAKVLVLIGIVVLAFNLRPTAVSVGPVIDDIQHGLGMSGAEAGILTSLPVVAFAVFGGLAPRLARLIGSHRLTLACLVVVVVGLWGRSQVGSIWAFLLLSLLALAGMATANVLMPSLVKLHFPNHIGVMTSVYSTSLALGLTLGSVLTVPIADAYDGWRSGLEAWALTAFVAALPWVALVRHDRFDTGPSVTISLARVARTRIGILMAVFFGLQSLEAYSIFGWTAQVFRDAGFSAGRAGLLLGVITSISIPFSIVIPATAARMRSVAPLVWALVVCYPIGFGGLILAPRAGSWAWAVIIGIAASTFPLVLTLIGLRARTPEGTAALSGFTQSVGYLIAAIGPFGTGVLHDITDGWTVPLLVLAAFSVPMLLAALGVSKPAYLEDQLR